MASQSKKMAKNPGEERDRVSAVLDRTNSLVCVLDRNGRIVRFNRACEQTTGYLFEELKGEHVWDLLLVPEEVETVRDSFKNLQAGQFSNRHNNCWVTKDGRRRLIAWSNTAIQDEDGSVKYVVAVGVDITDRKQAEDALIKSELERAVILDVVSEFVSCYDTDSRIICSNKAVLEMLGLPPEQVVGRRCCEAMRQRTKLCEECPIVAALETITERKRAEERLQQRLRIEKLIADISVNLIGLAPNEVDNGINAALRAIGELAGVDRSYIFLFSGDGTKMDNTHEWCAEGIKPQVDNLKGLPSEKFPWWMGRLNRFEPIFVSNVEELGSEARMEKEILQARNAQSVLVVPIVYDKSLVGFLGFDAVRAKQLWTEEDIAMLKTVGKVIANALQHRRMHEILRQREASLANAQRIAHLGSWDWDIVHNEVHWADEIYHIFGLTPQELGTTYEDSLKAVHPDDRGFVEKSIAKAFKEGKPYSADYRIVLPDGSERIVHAQAEVTLGETGRPIKMSGTVQDITERMRIEKALRESSEQLQKAVEGTIQAVAKLVEMKDPYTAGHQRRVAELACAIAKEMGLPKDRIEGLRFGALIHDVGKIPVPAGILNKPGRLHDAEFSLIKMHPKIGYDILKDVNFPWPVAQIILQHHERLNGSGYPGGLFGDDILLEAQILGVADMVEAMASHRPYRPAQGIDKALEQLTRDKGVLFNPDVVDACLRLFTRKGFNFAVN
ncbi:PAS domain S-box protein [Desulforudis sp. 1031]|uniref:PAS domain S-box protein n=2 Tax=unclassified Candidatus Desulforudis TaxID=2635950 RepID=UPI003CE54329